MMEIRIVPEWNEYIGIRVKELFILMDSVKVHFKDKNYGGSIDTIWIILTALDREWKQRVKYKKNEKRFQYDILLDFFRIVAAEGQEKKTIVYNQMIEITETTFSKYKFEEFDKSTFLSDFKEVLTQTKW